MSRLDKGLWETLVVRHEGGERQDARDWVAVEEPLVIRVGDEPVAVTMRTPGHDHELALGFLLAEGIIGGARDVGSVFHCGRPGASEGVIEVTAAPGAVLEWDREASARRTAVAAACGTCGRQSIDDLLARLGALDDDARFTAEWIEGLGKRLSESQQNFAVSGGVHAAALWDAEQRLIAAREDVGRHNAVDKVVGRCLLDGRLPALGATLLVSGRASFEIVQKAAVARIPLVVSVSAPSSLAVSLARTLRMTLIGFARGARFVVYAGDERITR